MKRLIKILVFPLIAAMLMILIPQKATASVSVSARSAILIEQESGRILYEKDANTQRRIASITKIMTAIIAIESGKMNDMVKVSNQAIKAEGSSIYLIPGEKIKLENLVYGLMLRSGNDAAVAIAEHVGGSLDGFVYLMNQKAEEIGMTKTHFANPHGLDDHEDHFSTAYDMALLTRYAMKNEQFRKITGTKVHKAPHPTENWDRKWTNKNRLLTQLYKYSTGGKTGYTQRAKRTLVSTATKGNIDLIAVTINAGDDWNDHIHMFETGFKQYKLAEVLPKGMIKNLQDEFYQNRVYVKRSFLYPVTAQEKDRFRIEFKMKTPERNWKADEDIPEVVGKAVVYFDEKEIGTLAVYYKKEEVEEKPSFFEIFRSIFTLIAGVKSNG